MREKSKGDATLLVASAGGHLQELRELLPRFSAVRDGEVTWVTYDTVQSRSLLAGEDVVFAAYANPRQPRMIARHAILANKILKGRHFARAISTGSSIALGFLPRARVTGVSCHYIESSARVDGPSVSGRILARVPGMHMYSQVQGWREPPWHYRGSVFDDYRVEVNTREIKPVQRIVVAVGSQQAYGFPRLIQRLVEIIPPKVEVLWQTGSTDVSALGIPARSGIPSEDLAQEMAMADVVVTHAGVGLALLALSNGHCPVVVPRQSAFREHVDDHQVQLATTLASRNLAVTCGVEHLSLDHLQEAASRRVVRSANPPAFDLVPD
jgi:UDP-N-acetylglucosamine transferase subunit ALG13